MCSFKILHINFKLNVSPMQLNIFVHNFIKIKLFQKLRNVCNHFIVVGVKGFHNTYHSFNTKTLKLHPNPIATVLSSFDTEVCFKDLKLVQYKSFKMNRNKPILFCGGGGVFEVLMLMDERKACIRQFPPSP